MNNKPASLQWHAGAVMVYAIFGWTYLDHGAPLTQAILGSTADATQTVWFLAWWTWAFTHHILSLHTHLVWQPQGVNLAWTTSVPLLAMLSAPFTLLGGPVLSANLLTLVAPFLAASAAYLLCLNLFSDARAAFMGGWLYGFSPYESAQSFDHLTLEFTCLLPLIVLVVFRRVTGQSGRLATILMMGGLTGCEFLISDETLASALFFAVIAFVLAYLIMPEQRRRLHLLAVDALFAVPIALVFAAPLWLPMLAGPFDVAHPAAWPYGFSTDLVNVFVPTAATFLGGNALLSMSQNFTGGLDEEAGYIGPVILVGLVLARRSLWSARHCRLLFIMLGVILVASLGPGLRIAGHETGIFLPWSLMLHVPLLSAALPARFMLYADLMVAIIIAGWLARHPRPPVLLASLLACLSWAPAVHPVSPVPYSPFFSPGRLEAVLGPNPRILILPFAYNGPSCFWQAENEFGFSQVGGYLGYPPASMLRYPAVLQLYFGRMSPNFTQDFKDFAETNGAQFVVAGPGTPPQETAAIATLDWPARKLDDVTVYTVPAK